MVTKPTDNPAEPFKKALAGATKGMVKAESQNISVRPHMTHITNPLLPRLPVRSFSRLALAGPVLAMMLLQGCAEGYDSADWSDYTPIACGALALADADLGLAEPKAARVLSEAFYASGVRLLNASITDIRALGDDFREEFVEDAGAGSAIVDQETAQMRRECRTFAKQQPETRDLIGG